LQSPRQRSRRRRPHLGANPVSEGGVPPSYRPVSHLPQEERMDQAQYQHGQPITPIGKLNGRAADALQKFTRPTTAPNAWDEDQPHSHILSGASSVLHVRHLLQAPPIDVIIPGQSEDALMARPGTHSPTNASFRATTIGEFVYNRTVDVRDLRIWLRNPVDGGPRGGAPVACWLGALSGGW